MYSGLKFFNTSSGMVVAVILLAATGQIVLVKMFLFSPSLAKVKVKPWVPNLAAE